MTRRQVITVGFMLFAMFFGAGNLIFPPVVGYNSGDYFWTAMLGFILTSVGLPLVASATAAISDGGYGELLSRIHPYFSVILLVSIYLTIGPLFAIPRTATTAYELGILPFMSEGSSLALLITSTVFFAATLYLVLNPEALANRIGNYLTPILLVTILIIVVRIIWISVGNDASSAINNFGEGGPFSYGFIEGYLTMDAIAAIGFAIVVISSIKGMGVTDKNEILKGTFKSAVVATVILALVFGSLGWIGNNVYIEGGIPEGQNTGAYLLQYMSYEALGTFGTVVLAIAVLAACITTSSHYDAFLFLTFGN